MGSIISIAHNPKRWIVDPRDTFLKETGERILYVTTGDFDDDLTGLSPIELYIRESIYKKLLSGEYMVQPGHLTRLIILDSDKNQVKPYLENGELIY